jgi:DNA-binding CsgD family transcriptional regulator
LKPQSAYHGLGAIVRKEGPATSRLILVRPKSAGPFRPTARAFLRKLVPQLRRALSIHEQFATLDLTRVAFGDTLDCLEVGVLLIDPRGRPYFMNRRAEALVGLQDGLVLNGAEIATASGKETAELRDLISRAVGAGGGGDPGGSMTVSRPSQKRPYSVLVTPIRVGDLGYAVEAGSAPPVAAIFISDPEHRIALDKAEVANHYGLTLAEAAVLVGLANGQSLLDIAADRSISKNTVRSHLQRVFDKTDTSRQAELVKLVLSGPAAVGAAGGENSSGT